MAANGLIADADGFRDMVDGAQILDRLEDRFHSFGATHFLATGVPLPGRAIEPLVIRIDWGDVRADRAYAGTIDPNDPVLQMALKARRPFIWMGPSDPELVEKSALLKEVKVGTDVRAVVVPICAFLPYQAHMVAAGLRLPSRIEALLGIDHYCIEALRQLFKLGYIKPERPGDLSARERRVVELSAVGKTANEIADVLKISQRTVHAHLQNASEKLRASNKTHTVVEALRYGQISV